MSRSCQLIALHTLAQKKLRHEGEGEGEGEEDGRGEALGVAEDEDVAVPKASLQQP